MPYERNVCRLQVVSQFDVKLVNSRYCGSPSNSNTEDMKEVLFHLPTNAMIEPNAAVHRHKIFEQFVSKWRKVSQRVDIETPLTSNLAAQWFRREHPSTSQSQQLFDLSTKEPPVPAANIPKTESGQGDVELSQNPASPLPSRDKPMTSLQQARAEHITSKEHATVLNETEQQLKSIETILQQYRSELQIPFARRTPSSSVSSQSPAPLRDPQLVCAQSAEKRQEELSTYHYNPNDYQVPTEMVIESSPPAPTMLQSPPPTSPAADEVEIKSYSSKAKRRTPGRGPLCPRQFNDSECRLRDMGIRVSPFRKPIVVMERDIQEAKELQSEKNLLTKLMLDCNTYATKTGKKAPQQRVAELKQYAAEYDEQERSLRTLEGGLELEIVTFEGQARSIRTLCMSMLASSEVPLSAEDRITLDAMLLVIQQETPIYDSH